MRCHAYLLLPIWALAVWRGWAGIMMGERRK